MNKTEKTVSIIIPTYNRKHLIGYTINNILQQTLVPSQIIVVDDHSTDGTLEWLSKNYGDKLILLKNKSKGPGAARNTGLAVAIGEYIQFFDSDDLMTPNKIETQVNLLGNKKDTFVYGPYAIASAPPDEWKLIDAILQYYPIPDDNLLKWIYRGWCAITQACLFPKELVDKVGPWREDIFTHEDRDYWYRVSKIITSSPIHENKSCTIYRQHANQLTLATERQIKRANDSLILDNAILHEKQKMDPISKMLLKSRIYSTIYFKNKITETKNNKLSAKIKAYNFIHRLNSKYNRILTNSNWQKMYGAENNCDLFEEIIKKIHI